MHSPDPELDRTAGLRLGALRPVFRGQGRSERRGNLRHDRPRRGRHQSSPDSGLGAWEEIARRIGLLPGQRNAVLPEHSPPGSGSLGERSGEGAGDLSHGPRLFGHQGEGGGPEHQEGRGGPVEKTGPSQKRRVRCPEAPLRCKARTLVLGIMK